ncbi:hypothetical protein HUJ04_001156 [Dendroctonus ponderosae]|nr:hypothetical protein HUJ04_001156 [Dendroctonus ponderosae]
MFINLPYFVLLGLIDSTLGTLSLQINKKADNTFYPVATHVEESVGTTFSLVCELVSTANETQFDDQLSWVRQDQFSGRQDQSDDIKEINKSEKRFQPLLKEDKGKYLCVSNKFNLNKAVTVVVRNEVPKERKSFMRISKTSFCNPHMFTCRSNGLCIIQHYVCDGIADCKDGSDESVETCNGDPCKDKIPCDYGRCIPSSWCCDIHHDPNCTVTNRPMCCQGLSECKQPYEEREMMSFPTVTQSQQTARYLFILVCMYAPHYVQPVNEWMISLLPSILFSVILLLLIISKVVMFAKKAAVQQQQARVCENIALRNQTNINVIPCSLYAYGRTPRNERMVRNIIIDSSDVNDPLLFNPSRFNVINASEAFDQPPSYVDVLRTNRLVAEPPPPYRSQEVINLTSDVDRAN